MKKAIHTFLPFLGLILAFIIFPSHSNASTVNADVYGNTLQENSLTATASGSNYPNGVAVEAGDMLFGDKSFSTGMVGHVGIVGPDMKVYHSTPATSNGRAIDTIPQFISRFGKDTLVVYRFNANLQGPFPQRLQAAQWAKNNINRITSYTIGSLHLGTVESNYCSKFVWQAYFIGAGVNIERPIRADNYHNTNSYELLPPSALIVTKMKQITKFSAS